MKVHNTHHAAIIQWHFHEYESAIEETEASLIAAETCPPPRKEASTIHCFVARACNIWPTANPGLARVHWRNFVWIFPIFTLLHLNHSGRSSFPNPSVFNRLSPGEFVDNGFSVRTKSSKTMRFSECFACNCEFTDTRPVTSSIFSPNWVVPRRDVRLGSKKCGVRRELSGSNRGTSLWSSV